MARQYIELAKEHRYVLCDPVCIQPVDQPVGARFIERGRGEFLIPRTSFATLSTGYTVAFRDDNVNSGHS